jgi:hypothetical protein
MPAELALTPTKRCPRHANSYCNGRWIVRPVYRNSTRAERGSIASHQATF